MTPDWPLQQLSRALHPLGEPLTQSPWNLEELADLLGDAPAVDAAVLVGLVLRDTGPRVLLTRRTDGLRNHGGQVSFPGGRVELYDADAIAAAVRETQEEIGLPPSLVAPLGLLDPLITITGFRVLPVVACIEPHYIATPDPGEVAEVFEVGLDFLMHPDNLMRVELQHRGRARHVFEFRSAPEAPQHRIWGATASILFNLRERLARLSA